MVDGKKIAGEVAALTGWTPPVIYELTEDRYRIATQADIDRMMAVLSAQSKFIDVVRRAVQELEGARAQIERS